MSKRTKFLLGIGVIAALVIGWQVAAFAGQVGINSGFEDDDGNLTPHNQPTVDGTDWNSFAPPNYTGQTAPGPLANYRTTDETDADGWDFFGMLDEFKGSGLSNADSIYSGGTKQSDNCPTLRTGAAPNKDDLKRVYLSTKRAPVSGVDHIFLNLAWVRIPLNSTQSSAHVSFEFNQSDTPCATPGNHTDPAGRSLVPRTGDGNGPLTDDLLVQYDFEGGTATPTISISRWTGSAWTNAVALTAGQAEAAVNQVALTDHTGATPPGTDDRDALAPNGREALGALEFGEAGVDLTAAGVFTGSDCVSFGKVSASSRSSGNSNSSNMFDIAGPGDFSLQNCGTVNIIKHTDPAGLDQDFDFTSDLAGDCTSDDTPDSFTLNDAGTDTETCENVPAGNYTVTEGDDPSGFAFDSLSCEATTGSSGAQDGTVPKQANITLVGGGTVTCTYVNKQQLGAIEINKSGKDKSNGGADAPLDAGFTITDPANNESTVTTGADGTVCVDNLAFGDYTVQETTAPDGYAIDDDTAHTVTVDNNATCSEDPFVGETISFTDTPLTDVLVSATSQSDGANGTGATESSIECLDASTADIGDSPQPASGTANPVTVTANGLSPGTYTCTIVIDP